MDGYGTRQSKTLQQIESELMEELRKSQAEWHGASDDNREAARERFIDTLHAFNTLILFHKRP